MVGKSQAMHMMPNKTRQLPQVDYLFNITVHRDPYFYVLHMYEPVSDQNTLMSIKIYLSDSSEIRALTKRSLQRQWKNALSHDWIPRDKARTFPLDDFYVDLKWARLVKGAIRNRNIPMKSLHEVFNITGKENDALHFLMEGVF